MAEILFGAGDCIDFGTTEGGTSSTISANGALLTNAVVGDLIVAMVHGQAGTTTPTGGPPGWAHVGPPVGTGSQRQTSLWFFPIPDAAALAAFTAVHTWTLPGGGRNVGVMARATGIDLDDPLDVAATAWSSGLTIDGVTASGPGIVVAYWSRQSGTGANFDVTAVSDMAFRHRRTSTSNSVSTTAALLAGRTHAGPGPTGSVTLTATGSVPAMAGALAVFRERPEAPPPAGAPVHYVDGAGELAAAGLFYVDPAGELATPTEVRPLPAGYASVSAMLAEDVFYWAHRGGSLNWAEMSLHAYTQAAWHGVGALEVSVGRTADGVFFGLHDQTLDRTSGVTGVEASTLTWAQIRDGYQISHAPAGAAAKPYATLAEILDAYADSHVVVVDPKLLNGTQRAALLDVLDAAGGPARFVWKFYGVSNNHAPPATARGYQTWGYFYESDTLATIADYQAQWSILGLNHNASPAAWSAITSYGKPVVGHIVATPTQAADALAKGAAGLQCSDVLAVVPRA